MKTKTPKIRYRVCKRCKQTAIVNPDNTLKLHDTGETMWSYTTGAILRVKCSGR
ncbi:MAG TPA: hypothetical protein VGG74_21390 [Kofleriaceae bacterium]|jgi:hypothetical protein